MGRTLIAGCGYVGSSLAVKLLDDGWEVWGLRRNVRQLPEGVRPVRADLSKPATLEELPDGIELLVYAVSADESTEDAYRAAYVTGVRNLFEALAGGGAPHRVFFVSSTAVYGQREGEWVDEGSPTEPQSFRGRIVLEGEAVVRDGATTSTVLRLGGIYGPGRTRMLERVRCGEAECPPGAPVYSNRIHREDAAGILRHLTRVERPEDLYLGVDEDPAPLCDVLRWIARKTGSPEPPVAAVGEGGRRRRTNKRCSSARVRASGYAFRFPTYREGYGELV